jgi:hypothetical protein
MAARSSWRSEAAAILLNRLVGVKTSARKGGAEIRDGKACPYKCDGKQKCEGKCRSLTAKAGSG